MGSLWCMGDSIRGTRLSTFSSLCVVFVELGEKKWARVYVYRGERSGIEDVDLRRGCCSMGDIACIGGGVSWVRPAVHEKCGRSIFIELRLRRPV